jgi:hypothetical protein
MFELWNTLSRSAIGSYPTKEAALKAVRNLIKEGYPAESLFLGAVDDSGNSREVAHGANLLASAGLRMAVASR